MKKIIPSILIAITVLQLFAPFSVALDNKKIVVEKNVVSAEEINDWSFTAEGRGYSVTSKETSYTLCKEERDNKIKLNGGNNGGIGICTSKSNQIAPGGVIVPEADPGATDYYFTVITPMGGTQKHGPANLTKCEEDKLEFQKKIKTGEGTVGECESEKVLEQKLDNVKTEQNKDNPNSNSALPACNILGTNGGTFMGCIAQGLYYLFFRTTSFFFGLAGKALDFTLMYSLDDNSYRSDFVVEGWGLVRDFCNMFFIFVLLYVAFGTILNLHGVKTKEMIINVVIIGLLMNFSLFATRLIIDASNILARVFYNQNTISVGEAVKDKDGNVTSIKNELGDFGEIKLSEAIVSKVDPQKLIIEAQKIDSIGIKGTATDEEQNRTTQGITTGSFIIITLLATAINVVGIIVFLSCAIIFIARVIGLWLAMILVPLAFFSYTVPALQSIKMVGWKHWWPETLKLAFLAPVFTFFMYIIVGFMSKGLGVIDADSKTGLNFVVAIMVPFVFIMVLLMKAKSIATDLSGEIGQSITNGLKTVGGLALGGAAVGGAVLGRNLIGKTLAKASRGDTSTQKYETAKLRKDLGDSSAMDKLNSWQKIKGGIGSSVGLGKIYGKDTLQHDIKTKQALGVTSGVGGLLNKKQRDIGQIDHARHIVDEAVNKAGFKDKQLKDLSGTQQNTVKNIFVRENKTKWAQEEEDKFRAGGNSAGKKFSDKDKLKPQEIAELRSKVTERAENEFAKEVKHASEKVNVASRLFTQTNTGSWDARKLSDMKSDRREGIFSKIPIGLIAAVATGVRGGIKNVGLSNGGIKVEGDFMKDLGNTISDSLKSMKVNVDLGHVGEHKSSADSHGGGAH